MEQIKRAEFMPYLKGHGPKFVLNVWDTWKRDRRDCPILRYQLLQIDNEKETVIFDAADISPGVNTACDSNESMAGIMSYLCLRLGDTDRDYFDNYTPEQIEFRDTHAEAMVAECLFRFGEM